MRTFLTLFVLGLLVLFAFNPIAGSPNAATLTFLGCSAQSGNCSGPEFTAANLDDRKTYVIELINSTTGEDLTLPDLLQDPAITSTGGGFTVTLATFLDAGDWTFELHAIGNNGNPKPHALATDSATFTF